jgi:hypothetical protein
VKLDEIVAEAARPNDTNELRLAVLDIPGAAFRRG